MANPRDRFSCTEALSLHAYKAGPYSKCSKISNFYFFVLTRMLVIRAGIHKMLVKVANREDPDLTAEEAA